MRSPKTVSVSVSDNMNTGGRLIAGSHNRNEFVLINADESARVRDLSVFFFCLFWVNTLCFFFFSFLGSHTLFFFFVSSGSGFDQLALWVSVRFQLISSRKLFVSVGEGFVLILRVQVNSYRHKAQ